MELLLNIHPICGYWIININKGFYYHLYPFYDKRSKRITRDYISITHYGFHLIEDCVRTQKLNISGFSELRFIKPSLIGILWVVSLHGKFRK